MIVKCAIAIVAAYLASVFVFFFIANIVCRLADLDTDLLTILSFVWPFTLVVGILLELFYLLETLSDSVYWKIEDLIRKREKKKQERKESK